MRLSEYRKDLPIEQTQKPGSGKGFRPRKGMTVSERLFPCPRTGGELHYCQVRWANGTTEVVHFRAIKIIPSAQTI